MNKKYAKRQQCLDISGAKEHHVFKLTDYKKADKKADIVVFLTVHEQFKGVLIFCKNKKYSLMTKTIFITTDK